MKKAFLIGLIFTSALFYGQVKGKVTDKKGELLPFVNIYIEHTFIGTTTNENGEYELNFNDFKSKDFTLVFKYLGFKTLKKEFKNATFPYQLDVTLEDESFQLKEIVLENGINPANEIIRKAIASKKENSKKNDKFEADFYSRGIFRVKDVPKKIMGIEIGDLDGNIDSTGTGIIYQSETISKIKFEKPNKLNEEIVASKIAGDDNGFSYNTALNTNYDFYENFIDFNIKMISPLSDNAFAYYKYKLEGVFYDEDKRQINKIQVLAKRDKEPVFEGFIYIVEDSWAIYGIDLNIKGYRVQEPILEDMQLTQNFSFSNDNQLWVKNIQSLDFSAGIFGINFTGKFSHVFSNYHFVDNFDKNTFGNEVVRFVEDANKKDSLYWEEKRPIPLTKEEVKNYFDKDSVYKVRNSKVYLDSIDKKNNKFKFFDLIRGYNYRNSFKKFSFNYEGLLNLSSISFNTVQGWNMNSSLGFRKWNEQKGKYTSIIADFNYGQAEDRLRVVGEIRHSFNKKNFASISLKGGSSIEQFNREEPISKLVNSISTLFFKNNYMKLYNKEFAEVNFRQELFNGVSTNSKLGFEKRHSLFNNTDYTFIKNDDTYISNNPLSPGDYLTGFEAHHLFRLDVAFSFRFGQKYVSRPDGKIRIPNNNFPVLGIRYLKSFSASDKKYQYDFVSGEISYNKIVGNKGNFSLFLEGGAFFNAKDISFVDFKHFNGNQTHFYQTFTAKRFNVLPYYTHSTNNSYIETHIEHNFRGYLMNKVPLLNRLQWNFVAGFHMINTPDYKPYQEISVGFENIGIGKFRFLRVDYVRSYQGGYLGDAIMFGLKF